MASSSSRDDMIKNVVNAVPKAKYAELFRQASNIARVDEFVDKFDMDTVYRDVVQRMKLSDERKKITQADIDRSRVMSMEAIRKQLPSAEINRSLREVFGSHFFRTEAERVLAPIVSKQTSYNPRSATDTAQAVDNHDVVDMEVCSSSDEGPSNTAPLNIPFPHGPPPVSG